MVPSELGAFLTRSREEKGLTLEDVESRTHIRKKYLVALEAGDWDSLPPGVYTRGLLRSYAKALGVSESSVARYYAKERPHEAKLPEPQLISQPLVEEPRYSNELILAAAGFALAAVLLIWLVKTEFSPLLAAATQLLASGTDAPAPTAQMQLEGAGTPDSVIRTGPVTTPTARGSGSSAPTRGALASTGGAAGGGSTSGTAIPGSGPASGTAATAPPGADDSGVAATSGAAGSTATALSGSPGSQPTAAVGSTPAGTGTARPAPTSAIGALRMTVQANGRVWLRVIADGEEVYAGFMQVGEQQSWRADESVEIRTGNAGGTDVTLNGKSLTALGEDGVVLTCTWRLLPDGAIEQSC